MADIKSILLGPIAAVVNGAKELISAKLSNDKDKIEVNAKLAELGFAAEKAVIDADVEFAKARQAVLVAEASSESWLTSSWRPLTMLIFVGLVVWIIIHGAFDWWGRPIPEVYVTYVLEILKLGITGYVVGRSAEKVVPAAAAAVTAVFKKAA